MTAKGSSAPSPMVDPLERRRVEKLLAPVRLEDPYPEIPAADYLPVIRSLVLAEKWGGA